MRELNIFSLFQLYTMEILVVITGLFIVGLTISLALEDKDRDEKGLIKRKKKGE